MNRYVPLAVAVLFFVAIPMTLTASSHMSDSKDAAAQEVDLEAAKATFEETCSKCHDTSRALGKKKDREGWERTVDRMSSYHERRQGGAIPDEDRKAIVHYLVNYAGE